MHCGTVFVVGASFSVALAVICCDDDERAIEKAFGFEVEYAFRSPTDDRVLTAKVRTGAGVERVLIDHGRATGVVLEGGDEIRARVDAIVQDASAAEALKPWYRC